MTTDPADLPQWQGHPVPWVARWSGEVNRTKVRLDRLDGELVVHYPDGNADRDNSGALWMREGIGRTGEPQFGQVSVYRQRLAMRRRKCQVCGQRIVPGPIRWLMGTDQLTVRNDYAITMSPPTCSDCIPLALELCPHLRAGYTIYRVERFEEWGLFGSLYTEGEKGRPMVAKRSRVQYGSGSMTAMLAKQQVVVFTEYSVESPGGPDDRTTGM